jgi:hypothetical protein
MPSVRPWSATATAVRSRTVAPRASCIAQFSHDFQCQGIGNHRAASASGRSTDLVPDLRHLLVDKVMVPSSIGQPVMTGLHGAQTAEALARHAERRRQARSSSRPTGAVSTPHRRSAEVLRHRRHPCWSALSRLAHQVEDPLKLLRPQHAAGRRRQMQGGPPAIPDRVPRLGGDRLGGRRPEQRHQHAGAIAQSLDAVDPEQAQRGEDRIAPIPPDSSEPGGPEARADLHAGAGHGQAPRGHERGQVVDRAADRDLVTAFRTHHHRSTGLEASRRGDDGHAVRARRPDPVAAPGHDAMRKPNHQ